MSDRAVIVVDTNVLLNVVTPVVAGRPQAPTGDDSLKAVLTGYDVHVPSSVLGGVSEARGSDDLLSAAAELVFQASHHLTTHDVDAEIDTPLELGLDRGESHGIWLANERSADMFVTDEFNTTNYLFISLVLDDRNTLFTTPHILCVLADRRVLDAQYVTAALTYYIDTKQWNRRYVDQLRSDYLTE